MNMKYISAMRYQSANGYALRLPVKDEHGQYRFKESGFTHFFSLKTYPDREAKTLAVNVRNAFLKEHKLMHLLNEKLCTPVSKNVLNQSGIIGVRLSVTYKESGAYEAWSANFKDVKGKQKQRSFSIDKYGDCNAFRLACEVRARYHGVLYIVNEFMLPCMPEQDYQINP